MKNDYFSFVLLVGVFVMAILCFINSFKIVELEKRPIANEMKIEIINEKDRNKIKAVIVNVNNEWFEIYRGYYNSKEAQ